MKTATNMKKTIISALIVITLLSCKKTPQRVVTENPTPEPIPCKVVFFTKKAVYYTELKVNNSLYATTEIKSSNSCDEGFNLGFYVGKKIEYSYTFNGETSGGRGEVILVEGCNQIELK